MLKPDEKTSVNHPAGALAARFYGDRRLIILTVLLAIASGASSLMILPRMEDPLLTQRAANIATIFPGADAERVEALVTEKIEDRLLDIPEIKRMRSQSRAGSSFITVELRDDIYDTDPIWSAIRGKLEDSIADLPAGARGLCLDWCGRVGESWHCFLGHSAAAGARFKRSHVCHRGDEIC